MSLYASFNGTLGTTIDEIESILTHTTWRYRGPQEIKAVGKSGLLRGVQAQQQKTVSSIRAIAKAAQDLAQAANQSTQLINDAIGGHVLIRQAMDETNEILIMDHPDPEQATKIWRWNMGGLGYSDNCVGADNPLRDYDVAMTMDGAINANFITTGKLVAGVVQIGAGTTFATGYDPSEKETPSGAQSKANAAASAAEAAAKTYAEAKAAAAVTNFISTTYNPDKATLEGMIDGKIDTWFYPGTPTLNNSPASSWTTTDLRDKHLDDLYYDTGTGATAGYVYRFTKTGSTYGWTRIKDADITAAMGAASAAQDTADSKRRVFTTTPTPPYDIGDLWAGGASGELKRCKTKKTAGQSYAAADWEPATKYTDDTKATAAQTAANAAQTAANNAAAAASTANQAALDAAGLAAGKGKVIFQSTAPAAADRDANNLWIDTTGGANTPKRWNGSAWVAVTDKAATDAASAAAAANTAASNAASAAAAAQTKADAAASAAATAQTAASNAANAASTAQTAANTANALLADIASDSKLTPSEKQAVKKEWDVIVAEKPTIEAQATTYGITTEKTAYTSAYNTLSTYITSLLSSLTTTSTIVGNTFRTNFKNYYDKRALLLKAVSDVAKTYADSVEDAAKQYAEQQVDAVEVGGRNLLRNSKGPWTNANYGLRSFPFGDAIPAAGEIYTVTMKYTVGADRTHLAVYSSGGYRHLVSFYETDKNELGIASKTFTMKYYDGRTPAEGFDYLSVYQLPSDGTSESTIEWIKLERGNKPTDWTPAPEDVEAHAEQQAADAKQDAQDYASQILKNLADGNYPDGTFITGKSIYTPSIYTPEVYAGRMHGLRGTFHDLIAGNPEGSRIEMGEKLIAAQAKVSRPEYAIASGFEPGHEPSKAFDGDTGTCWEYDLDGDYDLFNPPWIGQEFPEPVCVKGIRRYCVDYSVLNNPNALFSWLMYYDESSSRWMLIEDIGTFIDKGWSQKNVNPSNVYAKKWACQINNTVTSSHVYELEFYDERFSPFVDGYATKTQKAFELNAAGIGTFDGFFFMDGYPAGVIIEQGSNSNGSYIKWSNGLQVCWHTVYYAYTDLTAGTHTKTWTLPVSFTDGYYAFLVDLNTASSDAGRGTVKGQRVNSRSSSSAEYYFSISNNFGSAASVELFAIGWWKELEES